MVQADLIENPLLELTAKQREVLDLLIQHKTSKEISRELGISPHTVDQRIMLARGKLNVASRNEVAQAYRRLLDIYEQPVYELSHLGFPPLPGSEMRQENVVASLPATATDAHFEPEVERTPKAFETMNVAAPVGMEEGIYHHVLPEVFDGPNGTWMRLGYMAAITVFLILIVLGGLSMFAQLSTMLDR